MSNISDYNSSDIQVLEGLEAVRKRPGMYIGSTSSKGLHHTVWEIVDNSVDEYFSGFGKTLLITIHEDGSLSVEDFGRGIPVDIHEKMGMPTVEVVLTILHAGGKFGGNGYKFSGGLHGVGASVVNALSKKMIAEVVVDGVLHKIEFEKGKTVKPLRVIGTIEKSHGTKITYYPDETIFKETTRFDFTTIGNRMRESSFLNKGLELIVVDERVRDETSGDPLKEVFVSEGLTDYIKFLNSSKKPLHESIFGIEEMQNEVGIEVAMQYSDSYNKDGVHSYVNNVKTPGGGSHEYGFKKALNQVLKEYIIENKLMTLDEIPDAEDMRVGLTAVISVKVLDPEFEGQTKDKLGSSFVTEIVYGVVKERLTQFLAENPNEAKMIVEKIVASYQERMAARKARQDSREKKKREVHGFDTPTKLTDCLSNNPSESEIFIVEGDSAGGSAKSGRNRYTQAILPLRGKVLNTERASMKRILENTEILAMASSFGTGMGEEFNYEARRYDKFIIMTDADVDGSHIRILLLTFFYRFMRPLIERGNVFIAKPPLYALKKDDEYLAYAYTDEELAKIRGKYPSAILQRYKGLGEMDASQLGNTTMNVDKRVLIRVTIEQAEVADNIFSSLMGEESEHRKEFIQKNGYKARLDV